MPVLTDDARYRILRLIEQNPTMNQREIARALGISLGKVNFCLNALIEKGILKASSFLNSRNKRAYVYILTPQGIEEKARVTIRFLKRKIDEYETLQREIADLTEEARSLSSGGIPEDPKSASAPARGSNLPHVKSLAGTDKASS